MALRHGKIKILTANAEKSEIHDELKVLVVK